MYTKTFPTLLSIYFTYRQTLSRLALPFSSSIVFHFSRYCIYGMSSLCSTQAFFFFFIAVYSSLDEPQAIIISCYSHPKSSNL
ncbi:hypothetical protein FKM82_009205 [Ascaphus truei]